MKRIQKIHVIGPALVAVLAFAPAHTQKMKTDITTPDSVETSLGTLKFSDGVRDKATVEKVYDNLDRMRGVDVFLNTMAAASTLANIQGLKSVGCDSYCSVTRVNKDGQRAASSQVQAG